MQRFLRLAFLALFVSSPLFAQRKLGDVIVGVDANSVGVRVSANTAELNSLAIQAFRSHGRYVVKASDYSYDIRFTQVAPTQVRVDIMKGRETAPSFSQTVSGSSARNALLRAGDVAVEKTNGVGLHGFFASKLAFVGEGTGKKEIYVSDLFIGEAKKITNDRALVLSPRWSPDGSRILYTSFFKSGAPDIFQIDLNTFNRTTFVSFSGTNTGARFSPNGAQVAMVLSGTGSPEIYVVGARGGAPARKTHNDAVKSSPCWSPDGSQIAFAMEPGPQLYVMSAAGGSARRLASGFSYTAEPDWSSANPNKIACTVRAGRFQVAVYDLSTGSAKVVSNAPFDGIEPCWLADGRHLVYTARDRNQSVLYILDTESGRATPLTSGSAVGNAMQASVLNAR